MKNNSNFLLAKAMLFTILVIGNFACSEKSKDEPNPQEKVFDINTYQFKNQDPESIEARRVIGLGDKSKNSRTVSNQNGYANMSFNPSGYVTFSQSSSYRAGANIQNYFNHSITVQINSQKPISNIWTSGGSYSSNGSYSYNITISPYSSVWTNFDMNGFSSSSVEASATINMVSPFYVGPEYSNDRVYPIRTN